MKGLQKMTIHEDHAILANVVHLCSKYSDQNFDTIAIRFIKDHSRKAIDYTDRNNKNTTTYKQELSFLFHPDLDNDGKVCPQIRFQGDPDVLDDVLQHLSDFIKTKLPDI
jgi:hypothetical protein